MADDGTPQYAAFYPRREDVYRPDALRRYAGLDADLAAHRAARKKTGPKF